MEKANKKPKEYDIGDVPIGSFIICVYGSKEVRQVVGKEKRKGQTLIVTENASESYATLFHPKRPVYVLKED